MVPLRPHPGRPHRLAPTSPILSPSSTPDELQGPSWPAQQQMGGGQAGGQREMCGRLRREGERQLGGWLQTTDFYMIRYLSVHTFGASSTYHHFRSFSSKYSLCLIYLLHFRLFFVFLFSPYITTTCRYASLVTIVCCGLWSLIAHDPAK